ncbi:MAG: hypothetical protein Q8O92_11130, partial [Candidatus Latescibacter sp.]|nr:hypothetical protein [Candidatus Latescibacter sp.]
CVSFQNRCRNKFGMTRVILNSLPLRGNDKTVSGSKYSKRAQLFMSSCIYRESIGFTGEANLKV